MPLVIKVSVSRKLSQDYNSRGWTLDIQSEFDARTFDDTDALANSTNQLFAIANDLLDDQVQQASEGNNRNGQHQPAYNAPAGPSRNENGNGGGNNRIPNNGAYFRPAAGSGQSNGHRNGGSPKGNNGRAERPITQAQVNAINKMARKLDTNGETVAAEDYNAKLSELTIRQASELIDNLKKSLEAQQGQGAGR
jgi:hypothetical protein